MALWLVHSAISASDLEYVTLPREVIQGRLNLVTRKLADRQAVLESLFREAGCTEARFSEQHVPHSKSPNLICTLPGETDRTIVVGGHFDSIEQGMGAVDDWSGAVLLPSLYQGLKDKPRRHRMVFVAFAGEEEGLNGSHEYVKRLAAGESSRIRAMINLECLGMQGTEVWASRADPHLLTELARLSSALHIPLSVMNVDKVGDDDSHSFLQAGIPVLTLHSVSSENIRTLHSPRDNLKAIHADDYFTSYRLTAAYLAYLDTAIE